MIVSIRSSLENSVQSWIVKNVVHYILPAEQQSAIEEWLQVQSFPTYKLIDKEGNILDKYVDTFELDALVEPVKRINK